MAKPNDSTSADFMREWLSRCIKRLEAQTPTPDRDRALSELRERLAQCPTTNVIPFLDRNKGRVRKSRSPGAMGRCSLTVLERNRQEIPENVTDIRGAKDDMPVDDGRIALRLATAVFATLTPGQKDEIRSAVRVYARHDDGSLGAECRALCEILVGEPSC